MASSWRAYEHVQSVHLMPDDLNGNDTTKGDTLQDESNDEKHRDRGRFTWTTKREYILAAVGYCVGLGNIWRFPYICQRNGGGAFLIPYLLALVVCGLPLFFMEAALGQFSGRSSVHVWSICPLFKGIGIGMNVLSLVALWYYNTVMTWASYFLVSSCQAVVPWSRCDGWWNTKQCVDLNLRNKDGDWPFSENSSQVADNTSSDWSVSRGIITTHIPKEGTFLNNETSFIANATINHKKSVSAAEEFFQHNVLQLSSGIGEPGHVVWYLAVALSVVLLLEFCVLVKGIKSTGKVVYVTAVLPYLLLLALLIRGATLPGAVDGIVFYLKPDFNRLKDPEVWIEAAMQVFYSLGPAWGGIITMASYNKFHNNCLRDSILLSFLCEGTSIFGGFVTFSVLGYMALQAGVPVEKVVSSGPGLGFIVYPEAISLMPLPQLWAVLFFIMILSVAIDTQVTVAETVLTTVCDFFPRMLNRHRVLLTAIFFACLLPLTLPCVTQGGVYVFQIADWYIGAFIGVICLLECIVIAWLYGADYFSQDIEMMIGRKPPVICRILWCFVIPLCLVALTISSWMRYTSPTYGDYTYGTGAVVFGWILGSTTILPVPILMVYQLCKAEGTIMQRFRQTTKPDCDWGPTDVTQRTTYRKEVLQRKPRSGRCDVIRR